MNTQNAMIIGALLATTAVSAAERTWDGGGANANWSTAANWDGDASAPVAGDALRFDGAAGVVNTNDLSAGTAFGGLFFSSGAGAFLIDGSGVALEGDVINLSTAGQTLGLPLSLTATRAFCPSNGTLTVKGTLSGPGGLDKSGAKSLILSGSNTYEGVTTVAKGGALDVRHAHALGSPAANTYVYDGGWIEVSGGIEVAEPLDLRGDISTSYGGVLRSVGGDNVWSGPIAIPDGNTRINTRNGSNIEIRGGITGKGIVLAADSGMITIVSNPMVLATSAVVNSHGGGLKLIAVSNNVWRQLEAAGGETRAGVAGALPPDSELKVGVSYSQSGTFNLNGYDQTVGQLYSGVITNTGSRIVTTTAPATLTVNQSVGTTFDGRLTGELRLVKAGAGTLSLSGTNNTQDAQVVVSGGALRAADERSLGADAALFTADRLLLNGGTLAATASWTLDDPNRGVTLGAAGGGFDVGASATLTLANPVTGTGGLTKQGAGVLTLAGANDYAGHTVVQAGVLQIQKKVALYSGAPLAAEDFTVNSGATLALCLGGAGEFEAADVTAIAALTDATFGFRPGGRIGLNVANAPDGRYEISGTIGNPAGGQALHLHKLGEGVLALTGANTYTGATILAGGVLEASVLTDGDTPSSIGAASNSAANLVFDGGALRYTGPSVSIDRCFTFGAGNTAVFDVADPAASLTIERVRSCAGRTDSSLIVKNGPGTLVFGNDGIINGGANNFIGMVAGFVINEGTYRNVSGDTAQLNAIRPASQGPALTLGDGVNMTIGVALSRAAAGDEQTIRYIGTNLTATTQVGSLQGPTTEGTWNTKIIDVNDGAADLDLLVAGNMSIYPSTAISRIRKEGAGTVKFAGSGSGYRETTIVRAGRVLIGFSVPASGNGVLGACTNAVVIGDEGTQAGDTPSLLFDGVPDSSFTFARGLATWTENGTSVFGSLSNVNITLSGAVTVSNTLHLLSSTAGTNALFVTGGIAGPGGVTVTGGGSVRFDAANAYAGATTVEAGRLRLGAAERIADASALRLNGGTLALDGYSETVGTLDVDGASEIDFGSGACTLVCADSAAEAWQGTLVLRNFKSGGANRLFVGSAATLTADQLARITSPAGQPVKQLDSGEVILVPPGTVFSLR
ncbi:MAG: hypothetical protein GX565_08490 [Lentisphaerae bacterium]|nr:hypothetical protein [Lentisphaerota bacterium]